MDTSLATSFVSQSGIVINVISITFTALTQEIWLGEKTQDLRTISERSFKKLTTQKIIVKGISGPT